MARVNRRQLAIRPISPAAFADVGDKENRGFSTVSVDAEWLLYRVPTVPCGPRAVGRRSSKHLFRMLIT